MNLNDGDRKKVPWSVARAADLPKSHPAATREQLEKKAKKRAMWSQIGYAMLAGVAAAAQNNNYTATTYTPRGVYRTVIHAD